MSGTITAHSGLFWDATTGQTVGSDLQTTIANAQAEALAASTSADAALAAATSAIAASASAVATVSSGVATVNAAASTAQAALDASSASATATITSSVATAVSGSAASASAASSSATAAAASASSAASSATAASGSATTAATSASSAATSATASGSSATAAASSASTAASSASTAASSASTAASSASSATSSAAVAVAAVATFSTRGSFRNLIINGGLTLWQRGTSFTPASGVNYTADMVRSSYDGSGGTTSVSQVAVTDAGVLTAGLDSALSYGVTGFPVSGTYRQIQFPVEGPRTLAGQNVRLTFWAKAGAAMTITGNIAVYPGTGGSPSPSFSLTAVSFSATTSWQQFTTSFTMAAASTITPGTNNDGYILPLIGLPVNTVLSVQITGVQLELDTGVVTGFEVPPPAVTQALAQRYCNTGYWALNGYAAASGTVSIVVPLQSTMWTTPSVTKVVTASSNVTTTTLTAPGPGAVQVALVGTSLGGVAAYGTFTATASL